MAVIQQKKKSKQKSPRPPRIYILPTTYGGIFLVGAAVMILIGSAYQNNLVNMLAFFMLSLIFICMIQTHNNLKDLDVKILEAEGGFDGDQFLLTTVVQNHANEPRFNIEARLKDLKPLTFYESARSVSKKGTLTVRVAYPARNRGRHELTRVKLSTVYPLGLFRSWIWHQKTCHYHVYPEKRGTRPLPTGSNSSSAGSQSSPQRGDDFHGHRKFVPGDSHHHIDWKAAARGRPGLVKEFTEGHPGSTALDWNMLAGLSDNDRLAQLSRWIDEARELKIVFSLNLPGNKLPLGQGREHAIRCWEALSLFNPDERRPADTAAAEVNHATAG